MTCTVPRCDTPTADGIYLCDTAEGDLFTLLGQIPDTLADAADTVARLDGHATTRGAGTATTTSAPSSSARRSTSRVTGAASPTPKRKYRSRLSAGLPSVHSK